MHGDAGMTHGAGMAMVLAADRVTAGAQGHRAVAPDLPSMGIDRTPFSASWSSVSPRQAALVGGQREPLRPCLTQHQ
jgi:hypothetical protein